MSSFGFVFDLALKFFKISTLSFVIFAIGESFMGWKASLLEVCIFLTFVAVSAWQKLSSRFACPISATSAMSLVAYFAAHIRFRCASVEALSIDLWEYVRAIGLLRF